jgi:hypothetical protein
MTTTAPPSVTLHSPADLIAATPYVLGFHPAESLVLLGFRDGRLVFTARYDLSFSSSLPRAAEYLLTVLERQGVDRLALLGYGEAASVDPLVRAVRAAADRHGIGIKDALRVEDGRWWSYLCERPECCPPEGTPVDSAATEVAAALAYQGRAAAPDRSELARRVAPIGGLTRSSMTQATQRAVRRFEAWLGELPPADRGAAVLAEGTATVQAAIRRYADGASLGHDQLAWLSLLLTSIPVRDVAWQAITTEQPHLRLWTEVTRLADPALVAAPASLLAFTAWRSGDGTLATMAVERALRADPSYRLANLIADALWSGTPPSTLDGWGTSPSAGIPRPVCSPSGRGRRAAGDPHP